MARDTISNKDPKVQGRQNRINGFNEAMDALIAMAEMIAPLDQPGVSETTETHIGGYSEAGARALRELKNIKSTGIKD